MYGKTLKEIRRSKGYSQKDIIETIFSQSTYSNFESNKSDIHATSFMHILNQLQITSEELQYIHNNYQYDLATQITRRFFSLTYNNKQDVKALIQMIDDYLAQNVNLFIEELRSICEALLIIEKTGDLHKAREKVTVVWERMQKCDQWYFNDIKLINAILYFFDDETVLHIVENLLKRLKMYSAFDNAVKMTIILTLNLSIILIKHQRYREAQHKLVSLLKQHLKVAGYPQLAVCHYRLAICYSFSDIEKAAIFKSKAETILDIYEDVILLKMLQDEYKKYAYYFD